MPRGNKILIRTGTATPSASDFASSEPAWDAAAGALWIKNAAGSMVQVGGSALAVYAATSNFPATGSATVLYLSTSTSRLYRWVAASSVYAEVGTSGLADALDGGSYA
jgi:hypothetical protein